MKKQILTFVMLMSALVCTTAQADECQDSGLYVGGFAGVNGVKGHPQGMSIGRGFAGGAAVGYKFDNLLRVEGEFAYRRNKIKNFQKVLGNAHAGVGKVHRNTYAGMANVYCDLDNSTDFTPYIGGGIGYAKTDASAKIKDGTVTFSPKKGGFAYQGMAGVDYKVADKTKMGIEYRYFHTKHLADHTAALTLKRFF